MKTQRFIFCMILAAVVFVSCFSPWKGEEGNLTIVWGKSPASREFVKASELPVFNYWVTLIGPGEKQEQGFKGVPSATFTVTPGTWTVTIKGYKEQETAGNGGLNTGRLMVMGIEQVQVTPGRNAPKKIAIYTATGVSNWEDLDFFITENNNWYEEELESGSREEIIVIQESFDFITGVGEFDDGRISIRRPIILIAESDVTIGRPVERPSGLNYYASFFDVNTGGRLTLGLPGMTGTLTIDNENEPSQSLIQVYGGNNPQGELIMNKGVTVKNGYFYDARSNQGMAGAGVFVAEGAAFTMNGGIITGNQTKSVTVQTQGENEDYYPSGGGVLVQDGGRFVRNGGTISGNTPANVFYQEIEETEFPEIAERYLGGEWVGIINIAPAPGPITFTAHSISDGTTTINNVYSGKDHNITNFDGYGQWAFLFEGGEKIGVILYFFELGVGEKSFFWLGSTAKEYLTTSNNYGLFFNSEDYEDLVFTYNGNGQTI